ncbi:MAG TPA: hypothetical protein PLZ32_07495, partial [Saprospiraceae bacterium]|nr:hypothetical protein [Saprospiraceae bacterium]
YLIDSEFDSLHLVYINSLNLKYAVELSKMFDNDQGYRNSIKVKDSVKYIDSINILIFDNLVKDYGYPSLNKYGNDFNYDNESINCSPYILITHFGEQHWHRYLDTMILSAFHETDSWYDVEFIMKTIIMRKSNLVNFIPLRFVGSDSFKEFLLLKNLKDIFHQYPTLKWEVQIADNLSAAKTIEIKNLLLNCTQNNDQINFDSVRFKNDADEFGKFCVKFKRLTGIN